MYAYAATPRVKTWKPEFKLEEDLTATWVMETYEELAELSPFGPNGRVRLGFAVDGLFLPGHVLKEVLQRVRQQRPQLITMHSLHVALFGGGPATGKLEMLLLCF